MLLALRPALPWQMCLFICLIDHGFVSKNASLWKQHRWVSSCLQATSQWRITLCEIRWLSGYQMLLSEVASMFVHCDSTVSFETPSTPRQPQLEVSQYYLNCTSFLPLAKNRYYIHLCYQLPISCIRFYQLLSRPVVCLHHCISKGSCTLCKITGKSGFPLTRNTGC